MKSSLFLLHLIVILLLSGCEKDNDTNPNTPQELIKGKWLHGSQRLIEYENGQKVNEVIEIENGQSEFDNTKIYSWENGVKKESGTYKVYTSVGKTFIQTTHGTNKADFEIETLTKNVMVWTYTDEQTINGIYRKAEVFLDFTRQ